MTIATREQTATITGQNQPDYDRIVRPEQSFLISNYFINHWLSRLGPTCAWIVIALKQACWREKGHRCTISQEAIAKEIGLERRTVGRVLRDNPDLAWFIAEISRQPGKVDPQDQTYTPLPNHYRLHPFTPLIPEHLAGLYVYFGQAADPDLGSAERAAQLESLIEAMLVMRSEAALDLLTALASETDRPFEQPLSPAAVAQLATGLDLAGARGNRTAALRHKLDQLNDHLTNSGKTLCRQYFRLVWVPRLGPSLAWLVLVLRSRCYYNAASCELRDSYTWSKKSLRELLGLSRNSLPLLLDHPEAEQFFEIEDNRKHQLTIRTAMVSEPLTTEALERDLNSLRQADYGSKCDITPSSNAQLCDSTPTRNAQLCDSTPPQNAQNCPITPQETHKNVTPSPPNAQKCDTWKYFKDSILDVVGKDKDSTVSDLLTAAGLSGPGLARLCERTPPLDPQTVRAVILYAAANNLGPGYIYCHLERGDPVDPLFLDLAALDASTLAAFRAAATELAAAGVLSRETQARIPTDLVALFARYAGAVTGLTVEGVAAMIRRRAVVTERAVEPALAPVREGAGLAQLWERVKERLRHQMTQNAFVARISNTRLLERQGDRFIIAAPDPLSLEWLTHRLAGLIQRALAGELGEEQIELAFVI